MDSPAASVALVCFVKQSLLPLHLRLAVTNVRLLLATVSFCFEQQSLTLIPQTLGPTGGEGEEGEEGEREEERVREVKRCLLVVPVFVPDNSYYFCQLKCT